MSSIAQKMPKRKKGEPEAQETQHEIVNDNANAPTNSETPTTFTVPFNDSAKRIPCSLHGPSSQTPSLIFTHGAGGGITAPATSDFASGFGDSIVCFQGNLNLTSRIKCFNAVIDHYHHEKVPALGGRSMGARAAVMTALERKDFRALVLVSYPLLAGSKGEKREFERREKILLDLEENVAVLFVIGREDRMCDFELLEKLRGEMKARSWLCVVRGADHGMEMKIGDAVKVKRKTGEVAASWLRERDGEKRSCEMWWDEDEEKVVVGGWKAEDADDQMKKRKTKSAK